MAAGACQRFAGTLHAIMCPNDSAVQTTLSADRPRLRAHSSANQVVGCEVAKTFTPLLGGEGVGRSRRKAKGGGVSGSSKRRGRRKARNK